MRTRGVQTHEDYFFIWIFPIVLICCRGLSMMYHPYWSEKPNIAGFVFAESGMGKSNMFSFMMHHYELFASLIDFDCLTSNFTMGARTARQMDPAV